MQDRLYPRLICAVYPSFKRRPLLKPPKLDTDVRNDLLNTLIFLGKNQDTSLPMKRPAEVMAPSKVPDTTERQHVSK